MRKIEDMADSPLVPALLEKVHLEADEALMKASRAFSLLEPTLTAHDSTSAQTSTSLGYSRTSASSRRARSTAG